MISGVEAGGPTRSHVKMQPPQARRCGECSSTAANVSWSWSCEMKAGSFTRKFSKQEYESFALFRDDGDILFVGLMCFLAFISDIVDCKEPALP